jgi:PPOX class probable F420-dependent enzyme
MRIPDSYIDLLEKPVCGAFTTVMPNGQPQTTVVWCDYDGEHVMVNTMRGFRKEKNMRLNPKVTLLLFETLNPMRYLEIRGAVVEMTEVGAAAHLDELARSYTGKSPYFGEVVNEELRATETPVLCKIVPTRVLAKSF